MVAVKLARRCNGRYLRIHVGTPTVKVGRASTLPFPLPPSSSPLCRTLGRETARDLSSSVLSFSLSLSLFLFRSRSSDHALATTDFASSFDIILIATCDETVFEFSKIPRQVSKSCSRISENQVNVEATGYGSRHRHHRCDRSTVSRVSKS